MTVRTLVVWCPDWPLVAAGRPAVEPAAVLHANRVVACTAAARGEGVRRGQRRREAQARCPDLVVLAHDPGRDARAFEPVVAAVEAFTPRVEVTRPGACAMSTHGPSRYFGGDALLVDRVRAAVDAVLVRLVARAPLVRVGVADGPFAAAMAARHDRVIAPGESPSFLAPLPLDVLDQPDLTSLLVRLGLTTLGTFAALDPAAVVARFGPEGQRAHRRARGLDDRPLVTRDPPCDLSVSVELDPPADRVDRATFAAKAMADEMCAALAGAGLACTCMRIESQTEHGETLVRVWRHHQKFSPAAVADRVRWQLEGWLLEGTSGGLTKLLLVPEEVVADDGRQPGFWGGASAADERAARGLARLQGLLGPEAVGTAVLGGGRDPADQVHVVPWGDPRPVGARSMEAVWPGRIPAPAPAVVYDRPPRAEVTDIDGQPVGVSGRGLLSGAPGHLSVDGGPWADIDTWAGPWPADERWWDPVAHRRRARLQVVTASGDAHLLALESRRWTVQATYD